MCQDFRLKLNQLHFEESNFTHSAFFILACPGRKSLVMDLSKFKLNSLLLCVFHFLMVCALFWEAFVALHTLRNKKYAQCKSHVFLQKILRVVPVQMKSIDTHKQEFFPYVKLTQKNSKIFNVLKTRIPSNSYVFSANILI